MKHNRVPDILIEQYVLGELNEAKAREVEQSEGFAERVAEIERSNAEILASYPAAHFAARITNQYEAEEAARRASQAESSRSGARTRSRRWLAVALPSAAALAVAAILTIQSLTGGSGVSDGALDETVRLKGSEPDLRIYRSVNGPDTQDESAEALEDGARAQAGDRLQLAYNAGERRYGAILSVDGRGMVTLHYPLTMRDEPELVVGREQRLPYAYQLDDAPRFERFYLIASDTPFSVQELVQSLRSQSAQIVERENYSLALDEVFGADAAQTVDVVSLTIAKGER